MKPASLVIPGGASDAVKLEQQRLRDRAADETYFHMAIEPGVGATFAGITVDTATFSGTVFDMPPGAISAYRRTQVMRGLWPRTTLVLTLWYTSPVGSTNLFSVTMNGRQIGTGLALGAYAVTFSNPFTIPGPAVANTVLKATYRASAKLLSSPELFSFTLARLAPDANANALRIVYGDLRLEESA